MAYKNRLSTRHDVDATLVLLYATAWFAEPLTALEWTMVKRRKSGPVELAVWVALRRLRLAKVKDQPLAS